MTRTVFCEKLKKEAPGLNTPPYPGELGERIYAHICQEAWNQWLSHQTLLINEHRLSLLNPSSRAFLGKEMESFLFGAGSAQPEGFKPISTKESRDDS
jgi:Fe-S cluster biosynthesis and repair protein YggX